MGLHLPLISIYIHICEQVVELRAELEARNLPCKGLKSQLQAKLSKVLKQEMEADEEKGETEGKKEEKEEVTKPETATTEKEKEETKQVCDRRVISHHSQGLR